MISSTNWARLAMYINISARRPNEAISRSSNKARRRSPSAVPPGSRQVVTVRPSERSQSASNFAWVVLPPPSGPSRTRKNPRDGGEVWDMGEKVTTKGTKDTERKESTRKNRGECEKDRGAVKSAGQSGSERVAPTTVGSSSSQFLIVRTRRKSGPLIQGEPNSCRAMQFGPHSGSYEAHCFRRGLSGVAPHQDSCSHWRRLRCNDPRRRCCSPSPR